MKSSKNLKVFTGAPAFVVIVLYAVCFGLFPTQAEASSVKIMSFSVRGNQVVSTDGIVGSLSNYIGKEITVDRLENIRATVFDLYARGGFLAQVILPPQDLASGLLIIEIKELKLGTVTVDAAGDLRYSPKRASSRIEKPLKDNVALAISDLDFQTQALDALNGIIAGTEVIIDQVNAEVDVKLSMQNTQLFEGSIQVDNFGSETTGANRVTADLQANSLLHQGERLSFSGIKTKHLKSQGFDLELPVGAYGGVMVVGNERSNYAIANQMSVTVPGQQLNQDYIVDGVSRNLWIRYRAPKFQFSTMPLLLEFGAEKSATTDGFYFVDQGPATMSPITDKKTYKAYFQAGLSWVNSKSNAAVDMSVKLAFGDTSLNLGRDADAVGAKIHGKFAKLLPSLSAQYRISNKFSVAVNSTCQVATSNLDAGEKLSLGGPSSVRAYGVGAVSVNHGCYAQNELIYQKSEQTSLFSFVDLAAGSIWRRTFEDWQEADESNTFAIGGLGIGVRYTPRENVNFSLTHAQRIGSCTGCVGSQPKSQTWAAITVNF